MSYDAALVALAVVLYLYDSTVLLYANEAVLIRQGPERWGFSAGPGGFVIAGRFVRVLNPLTPHRPSFRLRWDFLSLEPETASDQTWSQSAADLRALQFVAPVAGFGLFVLLPVGLFTSAGSFAVIAALIALYGSTLAALLVLYVRRNRLPLNRGRLLATAFECLLCPPFAVNMVRRIALTIPARESLPAAGFRLLAAGEWSALRASCLKSLDDAIESAPEDVATTWILEEQKRRLGEKVKL